PARRGDLRPQALPLRLEGPLRRFQRRVLLRGEFQLLVHPAVEIRLRARGGIIVRRVAVEAAGDEVGSEPGQRHGGEGPEDAPGPRFHGITKGEPAPVPPPKTVSAGGPAGSASWRPAERLVASAVSTAIAARGSRKA